MGNRKDKKHKKKHKKEKQRERKASSSSDSSSSEDEWVEKRPESSTTTSNALARNEWLSLPSNFLTVSNQERKRQKDAEQRERKQNERYDPCSNVRELNPYWKANGTGVPQFKKPNDDESSVRQHTATSSRNSGKIWKKKTMETTAEIPKMDVLPEKIERPHEIGKILNNKELNALAAKLVKAEIMGNATLAQELTKQLESARELASQSSASFNDNEVILTQTDSRGYSRPLQMHGRDEDARPRKKQKRGMFTNPEHLRYFSDDKHSLKQMFEQERFSSSEKQDKEFLKIASKSAKIDDLDDLFADTISKKSHDSEQEQRDRAIVQHRKAARSMDNCKICPASVANVNQHLIIATGSNIFLFLPTHEPLVEGHCLLAPLKHVICSTQLDENEWEDIMEYRRTLTNLFAGKDKDIIFFEVAKSLHRFAHMKIECIPIEKEVGDLAPIYFKKAIDESETEWATNKKLVRLEGRNVRKAIPKGLPYFFVSFGMQEGFAHVIEDEESFPDNFAQEIIGGMLDLHHSKWRRSRTQSSSEQNERAAQFHQWWKEFNSK